MSKRKKKIYRSPASRCKQIQIAHQYQRKRSAIIGLTGHADTDLDQPPGLCDNGCLDSVESKPIDLSLQADRCLANLNQEKSVTRSFKKTTLVILYFQVFS